MLKFYENIPQSKFAIVMSLYRAFAEDSRERLNELQYQAYSTPVSYIQHFKSELTKLEEITKGCTEEDFYA